MHPTKANQADGEREWAKLREEILAPSFVEGAGYTADQLEAGYGQGKPLDKIDMWTHFARAGASYSLSRQRPRRPQSEREWLTDDTGDETRLPVRIAVLLDGQGVVDPTVADVETVCKYTGLYPGERVAVNEWVKSKTANANGNGDEE